MALAESQSVNYKTCAVTLAGLLLSGISALAHAHEERLWTQPPLDWSTDQIEAVIAYHSGRTVAVNNTICLAGDRFYFKVRDRYAFDIDETVWLQLELRRGAVGEGVMVGYDGLLGFGRRTAGHPVEMPQDVAAQWQSIKIPLEHARFANMGFLGSDFFLRSEAAPGARPSEITICNLSLTRTAAVPMQKTFGTLQINVMDERGNKVPARLGLYDSLGRLAVPNEDAVTVQHLAGATRVLMLGEASMWPLGNRLVFYTTGDYRVRLPVGEYELVVARGPEYRLARRHFTIHADQTRSVPIKLQRWTDMAAKGWYSGEDHIHHPRAHARDDESLAVFAQAEDLKVSNILQMGNIARTYFPQRDWEPVAVGGKSNYVLVPGQEDPRTSHRGHTIHLNIREPVRNPARYLIYHEVFGQVRAQGGLAGYAHVLDPIKGEPAMKGMAIDVPFGLVDFAEIMTGAMWGSEIWFDFLSLGYKLTPSAGSDYPYVDLPGAVRNYVKVTSPFTAQAWFDGLQQGRVFVTSGPMLEFSINGQSMGAELHVSSGERLLIKAQASMNPDVDALSTLELIEQGEVLMASASESGSPRLELRRELTAAHGTWFVLRARGKDPGVVAHSAPIYVVVDGKSFWKPAVVPAIVAKLKAGMQHLLEPREPEGTEYWETQDVDTEHWAAQQAPLRQRIEQAGAIYDELVKRAAMAADRL